MWEKNLDKYSLIILKFIRRVFNIYLDMIRFFIIWFKVINIELLLLLINLL